jgi:hypothetical protein
MAARAGAQTVEADASPSIALSQPAAVADLLSDAAAETRYSAASTIPTGSTGPPPTALAFVARRIESDRIVLPVATRTRHRRSRRARARQWAYRGCSSKRVPGLTGLPGGDDVGRSACWSHRSP